MDFNRRTFIKGLAVSGAVVATGSLLTACSPSNAGDGLLEAMKFVPGTYEGTAPGMHGDISVRVTVSENAIESIDVGDDTETLGVGSIAITDMPQRIIESQSLAVDVVSGATLTSMAIISAAEQALEQAGDNLKALKESPPMAERTRGATETVDVVIVGAGLSGINAAYELEINHPGVSYVLLEKRDLITGSLPLSGGTLLAINSRIHTEMGKNCSISDVTALMKYATGGEPVREDFIDILYSTSEAMFNRLLDWNMPLYTANMAEYFNPYTKENPVLSNPRASDKAYTYFSNGSGGGYSYALQERIKNNPIEVRTHAEVIDLIISDGAVTGVKVATKEEEYDITAKAVLLSCGGFGSSPDLVEKYSPAYVGGIALSNSGATGDAFRMTEQLGTKVVGKGMISGGLMAGFDIRSLNSVLIVNSKGMRVANEVDSFAVVDALTYGREGTLYALVDSSFANKEALQSHIDLKLIEPFDTLEDLAKASGIDQSTLIKTVNDYNDAVDAGVSPGFNLPVERALKLDTPPFYAEKVFNAWSGSVPGLEVDNQMRVLDGVQQPIPGLYASGELISGNLYYGGFPGLGVAQSLATYSGPIAITNIVDNDL
jgi:fumarate reductase flavoprotein subunit